jgi:hypothetical protein
MSRAGTSFRDYLREIGLQKACPEPGHRIVPLSSRPHGAAATAEVFFLNPPGTRYVGKIGAGSCQFQSAASALDPASEMLVGTNKEPPRLLGVRPEPFKPLPIQYAVGEVPIGPQPVVKQAPQPKAKRQGWLNSWL